MQSERYFLGRWTSSTWAWFVVTTQNGAADRHWSTKNLLIEFDEKGLVKGFKSFSDKDLSRELSALAAEHKETSEDRAELAVESSYRNAQIILSGGKLEFVDVGPRKKPAHFTIGVDKVLSVSSVGGAQIDAAYCAQVIKFSEGLEPAGGPKGKKVYVRMKLPELVTLLEYIHANGGKMQAGG